MPMVPINQEHSEFGLGNPWEARLGLEFGRKDNAWTWQRVMKGARAEG